jgi:hypothetical protein
MQVMVTIPDDVAAEAEARGLALDAYVEKLVVERASADREKRLADLDKFFEDMAAHSDKTPLLPLEAFTRESIYRDHD